VADAMTDTLRHRGPDACAVFADAEAWFALGRRLSVVEFSPAGAQLLISSCGRFVISHPNSKQRDGVFAGIATLRLSSKASQFGGVEAAVRRLIGMFAIALWDRHAIYSTSNEINFPKHEEEWKQQKPPDCQ
jgi:asparagine synthase (glutamine-hydrolysing)